jgi:tRNA C32,U32 (ribose-2'-O)-methylase TrmJ
VHNGHHSALGAAARCVVNLGLFEFVLVNLGW